MAARKKKTKRECEDCEETMRPNERRIRCQTCGLLICGWCAHHTHDYNASGRLHSDAAS